MLANPCSSLLAPGIFGESEGLLGRFRKSWNFNSYSCGYLLWAPRFNTSGNALVEDVPVNWPLSGNIFYYTTETSFDHPSNAAGTGAGGQLAAYGMANAQAIGATTAQALPDPAFKFLTYGPAKDARQISSCMRMTYTGKLSESSGQVAVIQNLPLGQIIGCSVDDLFNLSTQSQRITDATQELVYAGDTSNNECFVSNGANDDAPQPGPSSYTREIEDSAIMMKSGSKSSYPEVLGDNGARYFGFAWRGIVPPNGSGPGIGPSVPFSFEVFKNIEWRPKDELGITESLPRVTGPAETLRMAQAAVQDVPKARTLNGFPGGRQTLAAKVFAGARRAYHTFEPEIKMGAQAMFGVPGAKLLELMGPV